MLFWEFVSWRVSWDEFSTHPRIQRAEQLLQLQQDLHDSYISHDVARVACAKAEKEVATLKGIIANRDLMAVRTPGPVHQQPAPAVVQQQFQQQFQQQPLAAPIVQPRALGGKRSAEGPPQRELEPLVRAQIASLSRARAREYLKSMGGSTYGEPETLKTRLLGLFDARKIDVFRPGVD